MVAQLMAFQALLGVIPLLTPRPVQEQSSWTAERGYPGFGCVVGDTGDVDGDHVPDLVIGDTDRENADTFARFWIVSGSTGLVIRGFRLPNPSGSFIRVHGGIDVDRDGVPDLLIATQSFSATGEARVYVVSGKSGSILREIATRGARGVCCDWAQFVDDWDHDGVADVGVLTFAPEKHEAALMIHSGASGAVLWSCSVPNECGVDSGAWLPMGREQFVVALGPKIGCASTARLYSSSTKKRDWELAMPADLCGSPFEALSLWSDFDGDGVKELAISFCEETFVVSGKTGDVLLPVMPKGGGEAIVPLGDVDGDGLTDLAISDTESDVWEGSVRAKSGGDGKDIWIAEPHTFLGGVGQPTDPHHFGYQLATLGDVDADGVADLAVGTWEGAANQPGLAYVISGKNGALLFAFGRKGDDVIVLQRKTASVQPR